MLGHAPASSCVAVARETIQFRYMDIYSEGQKSTDGGDQYPKNTEEALTNNFAG